MPFPGTSLNSLQSKWDTIKQTAGSVKDRSSLLNGLASITRAAVLNYAVFLADALQTIDAKTANATTNGLLEYARAQENNPSLDLQGTYTTMRTQIIATQDWIVTNFPNTTGELRVYTFDAGKRYVDIALTGGQLTNFKVQLQALIATID